MAEIDEQIKAKIEREIKSDMNQKAQQREIIPETPLETAHILISNSNLTENEEIIEKEIKISNLDRNELNSTYLFGASYMALNLLESEQYKKLSEYYNTYKDKLTKQEKQMIIDKINYYNYKLQNPNLKYLKFDKANALRKAVFIPTLSRGKDGFERSKQVETISNYKVVSEDKTEKKPGFLHQLSGGFRR